MGESKRGRASQGAETGGGRASRRRAKERGPLWCWPRCGRPERLRCGRAARLHCGTPRRGVAAEKPHQHGAADGPCQHGAADGGRQHGAAKQAGPVRKRPEAAPQSARVACRWARAEAARGRPTERMSGLPPGRWQNRLRPPPARTWDGAWAPSCAATCLPYCPARLPAPHPLYSGTSGASSASSASRSVACSRWKRAWRTRRSACKSGSCTYADR